MGSPRASQLGSPPITPTAPPPARPRPSMHAPSPKAQFLPAAAPALYGWAGAGPGTGPLLNWTKPLSHHQPRCLPCMHRPCQRNSYPPRRRLCTAGVGQRAGSHGPSAHCRPPLLSAAPCSSSWNRMPLRPAGLSAPARFLETRRRARPQSPHSGCGPHSRPAPPGLLAARPPPPLVERHGAAPPSRPAPPCLCF